MIKETKDPFQEILDIMDKGTANRTNWKKWERKVIEVCKRNLPRKTYTGMINALPQDGVFVYGANTEGRHGAGAAKVAREKFGAIYGKVGYQGQSYGIVTKDLNAPVHPSVPMEDIVKQIKALYDTALFYNKEFYVAYSGTGTNLNHYTPQEMADMFSEAGPIPSNIIFEEEFSKLLK